MPLLNRRRLAALVENVGRVARDRGSADDRTGDVVCGELDVSVRLVVLGGYRHTSVKSAVAQDALVRVALATTEETTGETADETADMLVLRLFYEKEERKAEELLAVLIQLLNEGYTRKAFICAGASEYNTCSASSGD